MSPVCSAKGINCMGDKSPSLELFQRTKLSIPTIFPVSIET